MWFYAKSPETLNKSTSQDRLFYYVCMAKGGRECLRMSYGQPKLTYGQTYDCCQEHVSHILKAMHLRYNKKRWGAGGNSVMRKIFANDVKLNINPELTRCCLRAFVFAINITHSIIVAVHRSSTVRVASWHRVLRGWRGWDAAVAEVPTCVVNWCDRGPGLMGNVMS